MTPARFHTIEQIYREALDKEPDQICAFLDGACDGDKRLRCEVEALLSSRQKSDDFIEDSAVSLAAAVIRNSDTGSFVGRTIGHYRISGSVGTGGMGEVYQAIDLVAGRKAALKLLPLRFTGDAERLKRFEREARAVVGLNHPNIVTVYEIGEDNSIHYIASELIQGETLRDRLAHGAMNVGDGVDIAIQIATALAAAHRAGIIHRDIKPENIMLRPDGYAKVLDFGIAKLAEGVSGADNRVCAESEAAASLPVSLQSASELSQTGLSASRIETNFGSILGTVRYMSPEQARGGHVDNTTDIWSLGVVLYEMVTGHAPFSGETPKEVMSSIIEKEPPAISQSVAHAPAGLQQIVSKALRKDPAQRYQTAHELLHALKELRRKLEFKLQRAAAPLWLRWVRSPASVALVLFVAALALVLSFNWNRKPVTGSPPDKSIAVLPFENLSKDEENAFFAGGVQDEILTDLAKVADLKVISRTSVMKYKSGSERNLREIATTLGVSHVVEGSVQRAGNRVRVNVQLIDARNDAHVWAQDYDRDVSDIFSIQTEIAQRIADQLQAKLSPAEKAAFTERSTADPMAYAYYTKANEIEMYDNWQGAEQSGKQKVELLEKATQRDPNFALAYCALARTYIDLESVSGDPERKTIALSKQAADAALRIRPQLGEAHLELARYYFYVFDYDRAREELAIVRRKLPNNAEALVIDARISRHQNRWNASLANLQKASELDPNNAEVSFYLGQIYFEMRRYREFEQIIRKDNKGSTVDDPSDKRWLAEIKLAQGDPLAAQSLLDQVPLDFSPGQWIWDTRFKAALYLRDYDAASRVIAATPAKWANFAFGPWSSSSHSAEGEVEHARGDQTKALGAFAAARAKEDAAWNGSPGDSAHVGNIGRYDAGLGRKQQAIREARQAVELTPIADDSVNGPLLIANLALVYAWTGEQDAALEQLETVATVPNGPTYGDLLLNPCWDSLRGDNRFDKIVAAAKAASK